MSQAKVPLYLPDESEHIGVVSVDYVSIAARKLQRSINFYTRLFAFRIVEDARERHRPYVLMTAGGSVYLAIHEYYEATVPTVRPLTRWSFIVGDLDRVRETFWNLGVVPADGSDEPRRIHPWRNDRSLLIRDPDGHEIELVERLQL